MGKNNYDKDDYDWSDDGFQNYTEMTVDPGSWLLIWTTIFCFGVMLVAVLCGLFCKLRQHKKVEQQSGQVNQEQLLDPPASKSSTDTEKNSIFGWDKETRKILKLAIPYTISSLVSSVLSNIVCLIIISKNIGTKPVAAYVLVGILVGLTDDILYGPINACTTLCAHAVGAGNNHLAGQYVQGACLIYLILNIPAIVFWTNYMYHFVLYLEWGDEIIATLAQVFVRHYIFSVIVGGISTALWEILEVANHAISGTVIDILEEITNVVLISFLVLSHNNPTLTHVAWIYNFSSLLWLIVGFILAYSRGWLKPFNKGLFRSFILNNAEAMMHLLEQSLPLSFGSLLSDAQWFILTIFASHLGPAEVVAWALLGSIWDVFSDVTSGIGDAAELRVAFHLGDNNPTMAKICAYKTLFLGMTVACIISFVYFSLQNTIPALFTDDTTLQKMLSELVPFVGVANLTMTFGMICWSLIGAQGNYKMATWIDIISTWCVCMPLAALYTYIFRIDLQGLTSAIVVGYLTTGATLTYALLSTNWEKVAQKIQDQYDDDVSTIEQGEENKEEIMYAAIKVKSQAAKEKARRNVRLLTIPAGCRSGLLLGNLYQRPGTHVLLVRHWSPLYGEVKNGDSILAVDGVDVRTESAIEISARMKASHMVECQVAVAAPNSGDESLGILDSKVKEGGEGSILVKSLAEDESTIAAGLSNSFSAKSGGGFHAPDM
mmetsp:Transcript_920/g.1132  ORF Transcript_920/g.1132 Transcript_920/m.1132 type:complete len:717 (+) Transcript_920:41-2191(+)